MFMVFRHESRPKKMWAFFGEGWKSFEAGGA